MQQSLPIKSLIFLMFIALLLMGATIYAIKNYERYAYETTTINVTDNYVKVYSDAVSKGNSKAKRTEDDTTQGFNCTIREGDPHPYCIMLNWISKNEFQGIDFSEYKYLRIKGTYESPSKNDFLRVSLRHFNYNYTDMFKVHTYKYNLIEIQRKDIEGDIVIDLNKLIVPHWWMSMMKGNDVTSFINITNVPLIELSTGTHAEHGEHKIRAESFEFDKEIISIEMVYEYILIIWGSYFLFILICISIYFSIMLRVRIKDEANLIQINAALSNHSVQLEILNKVDQLTGVLNRSGLQLKMMECTKRVHQNLTVVMLDLDHFKDVNDNFGHKAGDLVLAKVGKLLQDFIQDDESVSRFGGEEFLILAPNKTATMILERLESLRKEIESTDMNIEKNVTTSMGVATMHNTIEFKLLIEKADNALYVAKNNGRNCIKLEGQ